MAAFAVGGVVITAHEGVEVGPRIFDFVQSPFDARSVPAEAYALNHDLTELVTVPGSGGTQLHPRVPETTVCRALPDVLVLLRRWFDCIMAVHACGYTMRGRFNLSSFRVGAGLHVKMAGVLHLYRYTRVAGGEDYTAMVASVVSFFTLRGGVVPPHLRVWLDLISEGVNGYEFLIRYHSSLMEARQAADFLMEGRDLLDQLKVVNPFLFDMILVWHHDLVGWNVDSYCLNYFMDAARQYLDPRTGKPFHFASNLTGVLSVGRNCHAHPARFLKEYMVLIVEDDFPGLLARFQMSLFRAGLLPIFCLPVTMA